MPAQIKHIFVLMMENRSFDHLFGFMKAPGYNIEGLDPAALPFNEDSLENRIYASSNARPTGDLAADPVRAAKSQFQGRFAQLCRICLAERGHSCPQQLPQANQ